MHPLRIACLDKLNWRSRAHALVLLCATTAVPLTAQTFTTLHNFNYTDGDDPQGGLVQATDGNLWGTTYGGGATGAGTVFKITPSGTLTTVYSFCAQSGCPDGAFPYAALVQATNGSLYGTTTGGGANGDGTVFRITTGGVLTTLHNFDGTDGYLPQTALVQATNGNLYGMTLQGGANGDGSVFKITPTGTLTTLYSFCSLSGCADGKTPLSALIQATNGNLYGTTFVGGANGYGTVFKITPSGTLTTLLSFDYAVNGGNPEAGLVEATNGNLYGTTADGFAPGGNYGTFFEITPSGTLTTLRSFCTKSNCADGYLSDAAMVQATDGNLYGTTVLGGANCIPAGGCGTIFKITTGGTLTTLHSFDVTDGENPETGLVQDTNGKFYGTTQAGGADNGGTIYSLSVGLGAFVETQTSSGKVGAAVKILGTNLTGATSVTFNGTAATFTVVSKSEITTTVPTGATTGKVQVVTPSGTLTSNVNFRVTP
jgi:uncharacterized repeat protein (TIGR03803 family)